MYISILMENDIIATPTDRTYQKAHLLLLINNDNNIINIYHCCVRPSTFNMV